MAVRGTGGDFVESIRVVVGCRSRLSSKHALGWTQFVFLPSGPCYLWLCDPENIGPSIRSLDAFLFQLLGGFHHINDRSETWLSLATSDSDKRTIPLEIHRGRL